MNACEVCHSSEHISYRYPITLAFRKKRLLKQFVRSNVAYAAQKTFKLDLGIPLLRKVKNRLNQAPKTREKLSSFLNSMLNFRIGQQLFNGKMIHICTKCGLGTIDPKLSDDALGKYYESQYWVAESHQLEACENMRTKSTYQMLKKFVPFDKIETVIEFGSASAQLGRYLKSQEPHLSTACIEKGLIWHNLLRGHMDDLYTDISLVNKQYDLFVSSHSLEHISDLATFFAKINHIVKPNGYIYFEVPNSVEHAIIFNPRKPDYHIPHTYFFTEQTFSAMQEVFGIKALAIKTFNRSYSQIMSDTAHEIPSSQENKNGAYLRVLFQKIPA